MISPKWSELAESFIGSKEGRHCHWCKHIEIREGEASCANPKSKFNDGDRIRTWDGLDCASECHCFELDEFYTKDENYDKTFKERKRK